MEWSFGKSHKHRGEENEGGRRGDVLSSSGPAGAPHTRTLCRFGIFLSEATFAWRHCWHNEGEISRGSDPWPGNLPHRNDLIIWLEMLRECFEDTFGGREGGQEWRQRERENEREEGGLTGGWVRAAFFFFFFSLFRREEISFVFCTGDFGRELIERGNLPSEGASTAHALITGDCDVECCYYLETSGLRRDTNEKQRETIWNRTVCNKPKNTDWIKSLFIECDYNHHLLLSHSTSHHGGDAHEGRGSWQDPAACTPAAALMSPDY